MWPYHPDLLAQPVPRYTSYPTALEFEGGIGRSEQVAALERIGREAPVSVYVHIPYCREICWYCGCNTGAANRPGRLAGYLEALELEIRLVARRLQGRGRVTRIAFGGGSPNALPPSSFLRLLDRLIVAFDAATAALSIELDPRTLDDGWYDAIAQARISSASLGCQTFEPHIQRAIGRIQPLSMIETAISRLRDSGIRSLNIDLMYGLPGQTGADLDATLDEALRLAPDRMALFGYAHLPSVIPRQRRIDGSQLPDMRQRFEHAALGFERLTRAGYAAVGFDHFALPGDPLAMAAEGGSLRRNFQGFTDDPADVILGLGASAISLFPDMILQNEKLAGRYRMLVTAGSLAGQRGVMRSPDARRRAAIIESLLCSGEAAVPEDMLQAVRPHLEAFTARNLLAVESRHLKIAPAGLPYARLIASRFDSFRADPTRAAGSAL
ncbi:MULTISPECIES: radical SAM protein [Sphingomonadaceae]|uniref:radical SAM protein n=1 Tax=Sphingomonadales TaxID=204457 RepID=UPI0007703DA2|nr:radical SAM protein [Sphingobium sp. TKS]AMK23041.1 coproporphyrinogen III oxidase [Sphingobium sp. TKS]MCF8707846.1 radical SAM protein [Rhizorhapis sp. SPR117]